jgi:20S proteasome subunit beta 7
MQQTN